MKMMNHAALRLLCSVLLFITPFSVWAGPVISEFMANNKSILADKDGEYSDWIEIYNPDDTAADLTGYYLTDSAGNLSRWRFPAVTLAPNGFLVVFASGKNLAVAGSELHTSFSLNTDGEYLALVAPDGTTVVSEFAPDFPTQYADISYGIGQSVQTNSWLAATAPVRVHVPSNGGLGTSWTASGFSDSAWSSGQSGVGYETVVPGFAVRNFKANITITSLSAAESVIADPARQTSVSSENAAMLNYFGSGVDGHYGSNRPFPGMPSGTDFDDFVVEATATIRFPAAGAWTFGVNSDDGFSLQIGSFRIEFAAPRGPADTLGVFNVPAAGDYPLRLVFYERGGGSSLELFAAQGSRAAWDSTSFHLVGASNSPLEVSSSPVTGSSSTGYASLIKTDVKTEMLGENASIYARFPFSVPNPSAVESLTLRIQYDDGFIAYLNGQEVARRNAPAGASWSSSATASRANAQAIQFEDISLSGFRSSLQPGANVLAFHGLNFAKNDPDFLLLPTLVEYQITEGAPHYFSQATPGSPNGTGFFAFVADTKFSHDRGFYEAPFLLALTTATPEAVIRYTTNGTPPTLANGLTYSGPIQISATTVLRAAAFKSGFEPSNIDTQTYLFLDDVIRQSANGAPPPGWPSSWGGNVVDYGMDPDVVNDPRYGPLIKEALTSLPSFSIVTDLAHLFDSATGIYANPGQDGRSWERPTSVELIFSDGAKGFQIDAGLRIRGGFSRSTGNPKHAFRLFFRSEYGDAKLRFPMFGDSGTDTFDNLDLRTFQNYSWSFQGDPSGIFVRDQFSRDTQLAMGHQGERGEYYHLYINGQYWGLFNTCERPEASYAETYFGGDKEDYDVIKVEAGPYTINATDGNLEAWTALYNLARPGLDSNAAFFRVQGRNPDGSINPAYPTYVDLPNLIDYMLVIIYGGNLDAPISNFLGNTRPNNFYGVFNRDGKSGFKFFAHDAEHTLLNVNQDRTGPFTAGESDLVYSNPQWLWQKMWGNPEFKIAVADHIHRHFFNGGLLTPESVRDNLLRRKAELEIAVVAESARWGDAKRQSPLGQEHWQAEFNRVLTQYVPQRSSIVLNQFRTRGLYPSLNAPTFSKHGGNIPPGFNLTIQGPGTVYYTLDGSDPRLLGGAVNPSAREYTSAIRLDESVHVKARALSGTTWSALNQAPFTIIRTFTELFITEIMYHPPNAGDVDGNDHEFIELKNVGSATLDLSGVRFTSGIQFTFPSGTTLTPGEFVVLASNPEAFAEKYPAVPLFGAYIGRLANSGETVTLSHAAGAEIFSVAYSDAAPWPITADGDGFSLVPRLPNENPDPNDPAHWRASASIGGSPGRDDSPVDVLPVWITEVLTHTDPPVVDAVELHNPNPVPVDIGGWYLTDNRNQPKKFLIPARTVPAGGYVVFTESDFNSSPGVPPSFTLSSHGEEIFLYSADAGGNLTGFSDGFSFDAAANGVSFGRHTISTGEIHYPAQAALTLGAANAGPLVGPVVINEIHYHPLPGDDKFIELKNISGTPVPLYHPAFPTNRWELDGIGFTFPENVAIPAGGMVLIVSTDPAAFRGRHTVPAGVQVFGPFPGVLQENGERLRLRRPDAPDTSDSGQAIVPMITVDEVRYNNRAPWPVEAAGSGPSLERTESHAYGNDPLHWRSSPGPASPGFENTGNRPPQVSAGPDQTLLADLFPFSATLEATATDDGLPDPPATLALQWRQTGGPAPVEILSPQAAQTEVRFPGVGTFTLQWSANDGEWEATDEVIITIGRQPAELTIIPAKSEWRYLDDGSDQGSAWHAPDFMDSSWKTGNGKFGYGDVQDTLLGYGPNPGSKYITYYFRRAFQAASPSAVQELSVRLLRDDGAVVYLNGTEVFRSNMPEGAINFSTPANSAIGGAEETTFFMAPVDPALLVSGRNVIAVEVHQNNGGSSDLGFDLILDALVLPDNQPPTVNAGPDLELAAPGSVTVNGSAIDDGLPAVPGILTISWSQVSGPATAAFSPADTAITAASFPQSGQYLLRLTANDGEHTRSDEVVVTVTDSSSAYDEWLREHFTESELADDNISGDDADPDGDGHTNREEFIAGTDPRDPLSILRVVQVRVTAQSPALLELEFLAAPGRSYTVQRRDGLGTEVWTNLEQIEAQPAEGTVLRTYPVTGAERYYRIVTPAVVPD